MKETPAPAGPAACAIIPARGGSKGIPRKNIVSLRGKPLIAYSIDHALGTSGIERVIVSTDDEEIASVARRYGAETPFLRPSELAGDHVLDLPVFEHALEWLAEHEGYLPDIIVHLRPTAPLRPAGHLEEAIRLLVTNPLADSVRSVSAPGPHPYRMFTIGGDGFLEPWVRDVRAPYLLRRQDLPEVCWYNAVTDVTRRDTILVKRSMTGDRILPIVMDSRFVVDIDTQEDLLLAEFKLGLLSQERPSGL